MFLVDNNDFIIFANHIFELDNEYIIKKEWNMTIPKEFIKEVVYEDYDFIIGKQYKYINKEIINVPTKDEILEELNLLETKVSRTEEEIIKKLNVDMSTEKTGFIDYPTKDLLIKRKEELRIKLSELK